MILFYWIWFEDVNRIALRLVLLAAFFVPFFFIDDCGSLVNSCWRFGCFYRVKKEVGNAGKCVVTSLE